MRTTAVTPAVLKPLNVQPSFVQNIIPIHLNHQTALQAPAPTLSCWSHFSMTKPPNPEVLNLNRTFTTMAKSKTKPESQHIYTYLFLKACLSCANPVLNQKRHLLHARLAVQLVSLLPAISILLFHVFKSKLRRFSRELT